MKKYSFILITLTAFFGCGEDNHNDKNPNDTTLTINPQLPSKIDSAAIMKPEIERILHDYYSDIAMEKMDENKYFAPTLTTFFESHNIPSSKVGESLRQGFKTMDNHKVSLDPSYTIITQTATGYEAEIVGSSEHTDVKTKKQIVGPFHNKIEFDRTLKITAYKSLPYVETGERGLGAEEETEMAFADKVMAGLNSANAIEQFIDPEKGVLYMYRNGVFDHIVAANTYASLKKEHPQIDQVLKNLGCKNIQILNEMKFDCDKGFSEHGCFLSTAPGYNDFSKRAKLLNKYNGDVKKYSAKEMQNEKEMENMVTHKLILTEKYMLLGLGKVNGKWRVITIDLSKFDCSA